MRKKFAGFLALLGLALVGCQDNTNQNQQVISERYIHKYGYDVSKEDWSKNGYPGQVITNLRNGITITSRYEDGKLHGTTTYTFPHSTTLESAHLYDRGQLVKKTSFNVRGIPTAEEVYLSSTHRKLTTWHTDGTPLRIEEYDNGRLVEGEYFTTNNKVESRINKGEGVRTVRNEQGQLVARETIENGLVAMRTEYYSSGTPHTITGLLNGNLHGTKRTFAASGEPLAIENWTNGVPNGIFTYFQNGAKYVETPYFEGEKEGIERHYVDGEILVEETEWHGNKRHGPSIIYLDGYNTVEWYYTNEKVSKEKYDELCEQERHIARLSQRSSKGR
ncbi:MAG: hypothetical protein KDK50_05675 [Chlamydiia bacterium]|nr:hypothetical protein [Chlamydiia bacterium]